MSTENRIIELIQETYNIDYSHSTVTGKELLNDFATITQRVYDELKISSYQNDYSFIFSITLERATRLYRYTNDPPSMNFDEFITDLFEMKDILQMKYKNQGLSTWTDEMRLKGLNYHIKQFVDAIMSKQKNFKLTTGKNVTPISDETYHELNLIKIIALCYMYLNKDPNNIPTSLRDN